MLSCKETVKILSSDAQLTLMKKLEIKMHLLFCRHCWKYAQHLQILKINLKKFYSTQFLKAEKEKITELENKILKNNK